LIESHEALIDSHKTLIESFKTLIEIDSHNFIFLRDLYITNNYLCNHQPFQLKVDIEIYQSGISQNSRLGLTTVC